jgi:hypothetical protein
MRARYAGESQAWSSSAAERSSSACERVGRATWTCRVMVSADSGMSPGVGGRAGASAECSEGRLWERECHRDAQIK